MDYIYDALSNFNVEEHKHAYRIHTGANVHSGSEDGDSDDSMSKYADLKPPLYTYEELESNLVVIESDPIDSATQGIAEELKTLIQESYCGVCKKNCSSRDIGHYSHKLHYNKVKYFLTVRLKQAKLDPDEFLSSIFCEACNQPLVENAGNHYSLDTHKRNSESFCTACKIVLNISKEVHNQSQIHRKNCTALINNEVNPIPNVNVSAVEESDDSITLPNNDKTQPKFSRDLTRELLNLITETYCFVCNTPSELHGVEHYPTLSHVTRVESWIKANITSTMEPFNIASIYCPACNAVLQDSGTHYEGKDHNRRMCEIFEATPSSSQSVACDLNSSSIFTNDDFPALGAKRRSGQWESKLVDTKNTALLKADSTLNSVQSICQRLLTLMKPDYCVICSRNECPTETSHYGSANHSMNVMAWISRELSNIKSSIEPTLLFCATCNLVLNGTPEANIHYLTGSHLYLVNLRADKSKAMVSPVNIPPKTDLFQDFISSALFNLKAALKKDFCGVCQTFSTTRHYPNHYDSVEHEIKVMHWLKLKLHPIKDSIDLKLLFCGTCNLVLNGTSESNAHYTQQTHLNNVQAKMSQTEVSPVKTPQIEGVSPDIKNILKYLSEEMKEDFCGICQMVEKPNRHHYVSTYHQTKVSKWLEKRLKKEQISVDVTLLFCKTCNLVLDGTSESRKHYLQSSHLRNLCADDPEAEVSPVKVPPKTDAIQDSISLVLFTLEEALKKDFCEVCQKFQTTSYPHHYGSVAHETKVMQWLTIKLQPIKDSIDLKLLFCGTCNLVLNGTSESNAHYNQQTHLNNVQAKKSQANISPKKSQPKEDASSDIKDILKQLSCGMKEDFCGICQMTENPNNIHHYTSTYHQTKISKWVEKMLKNKQISVDVTLLFCKTCNLVLDGTGESRKHYLQSSHARKLQNLKAKANKAAVTTEPKTANITAAETRSTTVQSPQMDNSSVPSEPRATNQIFSANQQLAKELELQMMPNFCFICNKLKCVRKKHVKGVRNWLLSKSLEYTEFEMVDRQEVFKLVFCEACCKCLEGNDYSHYGEEEHESVLYCPLCIKWFFNTDCERDHNKSKRHLKKIGKAKPDPTYDIPNLNVGQKQKSPPQKLSSVSSQPSTSAVSAATSSVANLSEKSNASRCDSMNNSTAASSSRNASSQTYTSLSSGPKVSMVQPPKPTSEKSLIKQINSELGKIIDTVYNTAVLPLDASLMCLREFNSAFEYACSAWALVNAVFGNSANNIHVEKLFAEVKMFQTRINHFDNYNAVIMLEYVTRYDDLESEHTVSRIFQYASRPEVVLKASTTSSQKPVIPFFNFVSQKYRGLPLEAIQFLERVNQLLQRVLTDSLFLLSFARKL